MDETRLANDTIASNATNKYAIGCSGWLFETFSVCIGYDRCLMFVYVCVKHPKANILPKTHHTQHASYLPIQTFHQSLSESNRYIYRERKQVVVSFTVNLVLLLHPNPLRFICEQMNNGKGCLQTSVVHRQIYINLSTIHIIRTDIPSIAAEL